MMETRQGYIGSAKRNEWTIRQGVDPLAVLD